MKRAFVFLTLLLGLGVASHSAYAQTCNVYAFGDSLSDVGAGSEFSSFRQSGENEPPSPPYDDGRFSDGPVWVESFAATVCGNNSLTSFAIGGANSDTTNVNEDIGVTGGLLTQVDLASNVVFAQGDINTIWIGANDYIFGTVAALSDPSGLTPLPDPVAVVNNIAAAVQQLAARGANNFVILNMPALDKIPFSRLQPNDAVRDGLETILDALSDGHNQALEFAVQFLQDQGLTVVQVQVNQQFNAILDDPGAFGFVNTTFPCLIQDELRNRTPTGACPEQGKTFNATGTVFWDLVHPTTAVHQLIAANAAGAVGAVAAPAQVASAP